MSREAEASYVLKAPAAPSVAVTGDSARFPVRRIYCVGQNYASHAREMGADPTREPPFFFMKPATALLADHGRLPYPPRTANLHHEVELVVALKTGGRRIAPTSALEHVYGYAVGNDFTRVQLERLDIVLAALARAGHHPPVVHAANSAAAILHPAARRDLTRTGIAIYGLAPSPEMAHLCTSLQPVLSLHARVSFVKRKPATVRKPARRSA